MAGPLDTLDPFNLRQQAARLEDVRALGARTISDITTARRALLPLPLVDRANHAHPKIFPPFRKRPIPSLRNKRIVLLLSGGSGACVAACGVARALEEAGIEPEAISVCSGSALWGSMMASGLEAQEMVELSLNWQPEDYLDIQWARLPRFALAAMRGFSGLAKGEAIEKLFDRQHWHMTLGETPIPLYSSVYNIDLGRLETFGSDASPDLTIGELVRIASALPLLVESVRVDGHLYADGGIVDVFPAQPLIDRGDFDVVLGVNTILPRGFESEDISGWTDHRFGFLRASRQISYASHLELARRSVKRLGRKLVLIDPVDYTEVQGWRFYDLFIDRSKWPRLILQGYEHATSVLDRYRRASSHTKKRSRPKAVKA